MTKHQVFEKNVLLLEISTSTKDQNLPSLCWTFINNVEQNQSLMRGAGLEVKRKWIGYSFIKNLITFECPKTY